ncbi:hypothetical protein [Saccharibacillus alkalitolerans]|uniref:Uncharacterized protein n=1 Tax=Saccharibacillus alkalitolerans TaxID=2705290 RepID=A0ABX0F6R5_9BACL|nr:hypothetical protein [Saccharibacillus alkalitolerans]NGZ76656.1 hypothetical protein [Saccharibacillus alkalitolerans]
MDFSLGGLLRGQYIRSREEMIEEYGGFRYIGWSQETGTVRTDDPEALGAAVAPIGPRQLEEKLMEESLVYLRHFEASGFNREVYAFGYHVDGGSERIDPVLNIEERSDEEERNPEASKEEKLLSPRWYGSNVFGVYPARFGEELHDLFEARLLLKGASHARYDEMYGGYGCARPYLFDVRIFDDLLRPLAFRVLERLRSEGGLDALRRTDDFMLYFFDHDENPEHLETMMRELNGDAKFERILADSN